MFVLYSIGPSFVQKVLILSPHTPPKRIHESHLPILKLSYTVYLWPRINTVDNYPTTDTTVILIYA